MRLHIVCLHAQTLKNYHLHLIIADQRFSYINSLKLLFSWIFKVQMWYQIYDVFMILVLSIMFWIIPAHTPSKMDWFRSIFICVGRNNSKRNVRDQNSLNVIYLGPHLTSYSFFFVPNIYIFDGILGEDFIYIGSGYAWARYVHLCASGHEDIL